MKAVDLIARLRSSSDADGTLFGGPTYELFGGHGSLIHQEIASHRLRGRRRGRHHRI
jgi:class 3 adenylate cyclase